MLGHGHLGFLPCLSNSQERFDDCVFRRILPAKSFRSQPKPITPASSPGLKHLSEQARGEGKEIVVVMGVGFVGAVMAAVIADTVDKKTGKPSKFVIGCDLPNARSYWKIPMVNRGESPVKAEDPEVDPMIARCVKEKKTLTATFNNECLKLADCVVVDVQCDYTKHDLGNMRTRRDGDGRPRSDRADHRPKRPAALPDADRDDRGPRHDGVRGLADHEEGVCRPRDQERAAAWPTVSSG